MVGSDILDNAMAATMAFRTIREDLPEDDEDLFRRGKATA